MSGKLVEALVLNWGDDVITEFDPEAFQLYCLDLFAACAG
jgi:hypothetical protein